jgi:hypothetical protein
MSVVCLIEADGADDLRYARLQRTGRRAEAAVMHDGRRVREQPIEST